MNQVITALISGLIFGGGLVISRMTSTDKVLGFLDITGDWDISLMLVMASALAITLITTPLILKLEKPLFNEVFSVPINTIIDRKLIVGAAIFGIGWGIYGLCPGPALVSLIYGQAEAYIFIAMMVVGMYKKPTLDQ